MNSIGELRTEFIRSWGDLGAYLGIDRGMARTHALLMTSAEPMSVDDIARRLRMTRANAAASLRELVEWGIAKQGQKEHFASIDDMGEMLYNIMRERKKREIEPVIKSLDKCVKAADKLKSKDHEVAIFKQRVGELLGFLRMADRIMGQLSKNANSPAIRTLLRYLA